ncbi:MAG: DUF3825 domain-containing protein [Pseudomonas sp.]|jgi:hypothetical protein|uniref:DUF3825 domain-containing protein n=1 Tax=unclassified Pseudomonas TaxID=196821 RepID=UPI0015A1EBA5|nr:MULTISPECIES: DUF3825 domain-containing protein [unclassified Pseudomonas]MDP9059310.1 DUF3825 domain-containing protein [Pseudomonadota bacterium]MDE1908342.1 DUF3825 domain-containing protein [Pseudomonas sp.]MDE2191200.1 DUF3825 domain-containing protein [Pseudomonas sp.]MDE2557663.1 DUF3825 domain-containing protein [Pseudomonas sp.]MDP9215506.1 DUF3825 domain-containing protein [Pseudomonadota bacterium]
MTAVWPEDLYELAYIPNTQQMLDSLSNLSEHEIWDYQNNPTSQYKPVLSNYLKHTYKRLTEEGKIARSDNDEYSTFNTGLVTPSQEPIYALFDRNTIPDRQPWHFLRFVRRGEQILTAFSELPELASYFTNPSSLVLDCNKELRVNVEHIVSDNKTRFPAPFNGMDDFALQTFLKGAIDNAKERVKRNYKTAVPQYYSGRVQLMLPLCISSPTQADLAIIVEDHGLFYRAATCLTLDMAYNNARLLAKPDKDWLKP